MGPWSHYPGRIDGGGPRAEGVEGGSVPAGEGSVLSLSDSGEECAEVGLGGQDIGLGGLVVPQQGL